MVFPVVMCRWKSWTIKKAEHWITDAFKLRCWRRIPWTVRRWNQSILKKINPKYSLEGWCWSWSFNTLTTRCEGLTHWKRLWWWEKQKVRGKRDDRGWDSWMVSQNWWTWVWANLGSWWWTGKPGMLQSMGSQGVRHYWVTEQQQRVIWIK